MSSEIETSAWSDAAMRILAQFGAFTLAVLLTLGIAALQGCASQLPSETVEKIKVVTVEKKVAEPCVQAAPEKPVYQWGVGGERRTVDDRRAVVMLSADLERAKQYGIDWEAATVGCVKSPAR